MLSDERIRQIAEEECHDNVVPAWAVAAIHVAIAEAAQVPVVERNQCDGCNRGLQVCDDGLHREPSGHPVMACTRNKYTHSVTAAELERLRRMETSHYWLTVGDDQKPQVLDAAPQQKKVEE